MTVDELLARARAQVGHKARSLQEPQAGERAIYQLGAGALDPSAPHPWGEGEDGACDCSAFSCWCLGVSKLQRGFRWLVQLNGGWLNTDGIWTDAQHESGFFERLERPLVGCALVYPSAKVAKLPGTPPIGHVGIVTALDAQGRAAKVIHCSSGNYRKTGDAIQETDATVFSRVGATLAAWCATVERPEQARPKKEAPCRPISAPLS